MNTEFYNTSASKKWWSLGSRKHIPATEVYGCRVTSPLFWVKYSQKHSAPQGSLWQKVVGWLRGRKA